jgi:hypothetical protein
MINKTVKDLSISLKLDDIPGRIIEAEGHNISISREGQGTGSFFIVLPRNIIKERKTRLSVSVFEGDKKITTLKTTFMGPAGRK